MLKIEKLVDDLFQISTKHCKTDFPAHPKYKITDDSYPDCTLIPALQDLQIDLKKKTWGLLKLEKCSRCSKNAITEVGIFVILVKIWCFQQLVSDPVKFLRAFEA